MNLIKRILLNTLFLSMLPFFASCSQNNNLTNDISINNNSQDNTNLKNLDTIKLQSLVTKINNGQFGDVHSLIISRNNQIILEEYINGYDSDNLHILYSATKSVTSALIGIAIDNLDENPLDFLP